MKFVISFVAFFLILNSSMAQYVALYQNTPNQKLVPNLETSIDTMGILITSAVSEPSYQYFRAKADTVKRPCVIICPGGAYFILADGHEGVDVAKYFNSIGVNAMVLKYRIPDNNNQIDKSIAPLQDAQQAMYLARKNASIWGIDEHKIGIMGFSAGGHLAASLASHYSDVKISNDEQISLRPDFQILIYPVITTKSFGHSGSTLNLIGPNPTEEQINYFSNESWVNTQSPITFIVHAKDDDAVPVKNAEIYNEAFIKNKVASKLYLFEKGGHGFGMKNKMSEKQWPPILEAWLFENKIL